MNPNAVVLVVPVFGMMLVGLVVFTRSHLGHAIAERIAGRAGVSPEIEGELRELRGEVESLRTELLETQERLDFTERLIASGKPER